MMSYCIEQHNYRELHVVDRDADEVCVIPELGSIVTSRYDVSESIGVVIAVLGYDITVMWTPARQDIHINVQNIRAVTKKLRVKWSVEDSDDITK